MKLRARYLKRYNFFNVKFSARLTKKKKKGARERTQNHKKKNVTNHTTEIQRILRQLNTN